MIKCKIKDIVTLSSETLVPQEGIAYHLYSLPSFDEGRQREEVMGEDIGSNKFIVPDKCILFNKLNVRFKRVWRIDNTDNNKLASTEFLPLIVDEEKVDFQYCYYLLISDSITKYLSGQTANTSGSHKRISPDDFLNIEVAIPEMTEQKRIGGFLSSIDRKIDVNQALNQDLENLAKQIYDYWFVQFDFPDDNGRPYKSSGGKMVWNETLKREIPEGWDVKNLIDIADIVNGATPSTSDETNYEGDIMWITPKDLSDQGQKFIFHGARTISQKGYDSCSTTMLPKGSILMSSRAPIGLFAIAQNEVCTNQGFKSFVPNDETDGMYLYYYLRQHIKQIEQLGTGTTFKEVSRDDLKKFPILYVTDRDTYFQWVEKLRPMFDLQAKLQNESEELQSLRSYLLPLLMNGQAKLK